ncbi:hypothetical protein JCM10207_006340 [Rhodosporidiobolus poonsookiae]
MPVPSLPLELVGLILTEVRLSCDDDDAARRSNGLAAALVCKAWQPYGVAAIWHTVKLNSLHQARYLAEQSEHFAHFPPLIKEMSLEPSLSDDVDLAGEDVVAELGSLWSRCTHLQVLTAEQVVPWLDYLEIALYLPSLKRLQHLEVDGSNLAYAYPLLLLPPLATLDDLISFTLILVHMQPHRFPPRPHAAKPVRCRRVDVTLIVTHPEEGVSFFALSLLDGIDASSLHSLHFTAYPADLPLVDRMFRFPSLRTFHLMLQNPTAAIPLVERALHLVKSHPRPLELVIGGSGCTTPLCLGDSRSATLSTFLAAIPTSIATFAFTTFHLIDDDSLDVDEAVPVAVLAPPATVHNIEAALAASDCTGSCLVKTVGGVEGDKVTQRLCVRETGEDGEPRWTVVVRE